jgi:hypothetical protein
VCLHLAFLIIGFPFHCLDSKCTTNWDTDGATLSSGFSLWLSEFRFLYSYTG